MKRVAVCLVVLACNLSAAAQGAPEPWDAQAEQQLLDATRAREMSKLDAEEAACYARFAVSGCLSEVQVRRRALVAQLRRQEAALHERQFAQAAEQQRLQSQQKVSERQQQEADGRVAAEQAEDKRQAQVNKQRDHAAQLHQAQSSSTGAAAVPTGPAGPTPAEQAANRDSYARKLADAQKKRMERDKRQAEPAKRAAPLPLPP